MLLWLQEGREANHCLWLVVEQLLSPSLSSALLCAESQQRYRNPLLWHKACVGGDFGAFFLPIPTCSEQWQNVPTSISSHYPQTYLTSTVCSSLVFPFVFPQLNSIGKERGNGERTGLNPFSYISANLKSPQTSMHLLALLLGLHLNLMGAVMNVSSSELPRGKTVT